MTITTLVASSSFYFMLFGRAGSFSMDYNRKKDRVAWKKNLIKKNKIKFFFHSFPLVIYRLIFSTIYDNKKTIFLVIWVIFKENIFFCRDVR